MDDIDQPPQNSNNSSMTVPPKNHDMCCCGKIELRTGIIILSIITMLVSILFIVFAAFFVAAVPWWVYAGTISGAVGGLLGFFGSCFNSAKSTFLFELWAIIMLLWWGVFVVITAIDIANGNHGGVIWDILYSGGLFAWSCYALYVIHKYYTKMKPKGSRWNPYKKGNAQTEPLTQNDNV